MSNKPRKTRRDSALALVTTEQRKLIAEWLAEDGEESCRQRIFSELHIASPQDPAKPISRDALYTALARWRSEDRFANFEEIARGMAELEAQLNGLTVEQMEEKVDRYFAMLAAKNEDTSLYKELRYLRIADQSAKSQARIAEAKLKQGEAKLRQKDRDLELAERRVALLEKKIAEASQAAEDKTLSADERAERMREILRA